MDRIGKLRELIDKNPQDDFSCHALALEYVKIGNDGEARHLFEAILARNAAYIGSYYHLGKLLERKGDREGSIRIYELGIAEASRLGEEHARRELMAARDLID